MIFLVLPRCPDRCVPMRLLQNYSRRIVLEISGFYVRTRCNCGFFSTPPATALRGSAVRWCSERIRTVRPDPPPFLSLRLAAFIALLMLKKAEMGHAYVRDAPQEWTTTQEKNSPFTHFSH